MNYGRLITRLNLNENNELPLFTHVSVFPNFEKDDSTLNFFQRLSYTHTQIPGKSEYVSKDIRLSNLFIQYENPENLWIDQTQMLIYILQHLLEQLAITLGKTSSHKYKLYLYKTPEERFAKKEITYSLKEEEKNEKKKTNYEIMLIIQKLIKEKIDNVFLFVHNILRDTCDELRSAKTFSILQRALDNINATKADDITILNMKADELYKHLFSDVKRIEKELDRLFENTRALSYGFISEKDRMQFIYLKQIDYIEKWEKSRRWLNKYLCNKQCEENIKYIRSVESKITKDEEVTTQITMFLESHILELKQKRDEYPEKLDKEHDARCRDITQLKEELEEMRIYKKQLSDEYILRTQQIIDWKNYKAKKEIEDAEKQRIAEEEELARQQEEERIAAELAAEEEYLETLTPREREQYLKNKKKQQRKAAKAAKAALKKRRKA